VKTSSTRDDVAKKIVELLRPLASPPIPVTNPVATF
jgi:hypothetical protein